MSKLTGEWEVHTSWAVLIQHFIPLLISCFSYTSFYLFTIYISSWSEHFDNTSFCWAHLCSCTVGSNASVVDVVVRWWTLMISRSCVKVKVKGQGHHVKKRDFQALCMVYLTCGLEVRGHKGQGQRSRGSRSKVWVVGQRSRSPWKKNMFFILAE